MSYLLKQPISSNWFSDKLGYQILGDPIMINSIAPLSNPNPNSLIFSTSIVEVPSNIAVIGPKELKQSQTVVIPSEQPRLDFIKIVTALESHIGFQKDQFPPRIQPTVKIEKNVFVGKGVEIGAGTQIYHNVVIGDGVKIGKNCLIKSGAVIGEEGFGFQRDVGGIPLRMPHLGTVIIGNEVEIGSLTTVSRGVLEDTIIEDYVKIDDRCQIAHNCHIKKKTMIASGAAIAGSVVVGEECWISPSSTIMDKLKIGDRAFIGLGAVALRDVDRDTKVFGNPARTVRKQN